MRLRIIGVDDADYAERDATPEAVRAALTPPELWYGAGVELLPADPVASCLNAVAVAGPYARAGEPGEFLVGFDEGGTWYSEASGRRFTRREVVGSFLRYLAGERAWVDDLAWAEAVAGRRTGRLRAPAIYRGAEAARVCGDATPRPSASARLGRVAPAAPVSLTRALGGTQAEARCWAVHGAGVPRAAGECG